MTGGPGREAPGRVQFPQLLRRRGRAQNNADVMRGLVLCCLAAGCGVQLEGGGSSNTTPDGSTSPGVDASPGIDAAPRCGNGRVVYLNFEGQTLTDGPSDATQNRASWMTIQQGTAPRYRSGAADRDQQIQTIVDGVRAILAPFPIDVVTTRPAAGPYVMIVYGGTTNQVGSNFIAVNELDCGDLRKSDVAWMADSLSPPQRVINYSVGAIGFGLGLTATNDSLGCMCQWDNDCVQQTAQPCRLSPMINRDQNADQTCPGLISQNEVAAFETEFCR